MSTLSPNHHSELLFNRHPAGPNRHSALSPNRHPAGPNRHSGLSPNRHPAGHPEFRYAALWLALLAVAALSPPVLAQGAGTAQVAVQTAIHASMHKGDKAMPELVDINTASAVQIAKAMKGVGKKVATRVVKFREEHGPFPTVDALVEVRGIGKKLLKRNRHRLMVTPVQEEQ